MARINTPQKGQPIDLSYIAEMSNAINELSDAIVPGTSNFVTVDSGDGDVSTRTSQAKVIGKYIQVSTGTAQTANATLPAQYSFDATFAYTPMVTATVVANDSDAASIAATVVISSVTTNQVQLIVNFPVAGNPNVGVNILAVGIPNTLA